MRKDKTISRAFERYFEGAEAPRVNLDPAKEALRASARRREQRKRRLKWRLPVLAAALLLAVVLCLDFLPALTVKRYLLSEAETSRLSYTEVNERYAGFLDGLNRFALASNASADYTLYRYDDKDVLLEADVSILKGFSKLRAAVRVDLTDGKYAAEELKDYPASYKKDSPVYESDYVNGEIVYRGTAKRDEKEYFFDCSLNGDPALFNWFLERLV